jgi:hypothetical protein
LTGHLLSIFGIEESSEKMGKGKKGEQIFNEDNDAVHETMALIQKDGMKPTKEEIDAMEAGGAGRGQPTIKAPDAAAPVEKKQEAAAAGIGMMLMVSGLFFAADIGKNVIETNVVNGFGARVNSSFFSFLLAVTNLLLAALLTYVRQGGEGMKKLIDVQKIIDFSMPAAFFAIQAALMQLASLFLSGSMKKVLGQLRIPLTMVMSGTIMGATYSGLQKLAVGMILSSVFLFIGVVNGGSVLGNMDGDFMIGLLVMILANLAAVFATLVSEKFLKKGAKTSFYIQMFWIQITQSLISFLMYILIVPYGLGHSFKVLLPLLGQADKSTELLKKQNPFAVRSNLLLAQGGYPFGIMVDNEGNTDELITTAVNKVNSYKAMRVMLLTELTVSGDYFKAPAAPAAETVALSSAIDALLKSKNDDKKVEAATTTFLEDAAVKALAGESKINALDGYSSDKKLTPVEQKAAINDAIVAKSQGFGLSKKSALTKAEIVLAETVGMLENGLFVEAWLAKTDSSFVCKVFGNAYVDALNALEQLSTADKKFMTSYPFQRSTKKQQPEDMENNFVLSSGDFHEADEAVFGQAFHGAVFTKKTVGEGAAAVVAYITPEIKLSDKKKKVAKAGVKKVQFKAEVDSDKIESSTDGKTWTPLLQCSVADPNDAEKKVYVIFSDFAKRTNSFFENCDFVATIDATEPKPKAFTITQQPGKFGAGTKVGDFTVCDYRCKSELIDKVDYEKNFGWWTNYNQFFPEFKVEGGAKADQSKYAFVKPSGPFGLYTANPFAGMFDTPLLLIAAICNIAATWMSALVTKTLSSLHKQIISAVCLAAINLIEFSLVWQPSKVSKIPVDNFLVGVAGVILSALLYSQAPKAPKKVEAKKD